MPLRIAAEGCAFILDDTTNQIVGLKQRDGTEHFFPLLTSQPAAYGATLPELGTWTPVLTAATPGDLTQTFGTQVGTYTKIGRLVIIQCHLAWTAFTHTTASGAITISGLPFPGRTTPTGYWSSAACTFGGFTKANYTTLAAYIANNANTVLNFQWSGSAQALVGAAITDIPTGGTVRLRFSLVYETD